MTRTSKLKFLITTLITAVVTIIFAFAMVVPNVGKIVESYNDTSYYLNSNFDFGIVGQSVQQVEEYRNNKNVKAVAPYFEGTILVNNNTQNEVTVYAFEKLEDINYSPFTTNRVVSLSESNNKKQIYIDVNLQNNGYKLGDNVSVKMAGKTDNFEITKILEPLPNNAQGYAVLVYDTTLFGNISNSAFIKANDINAVDEMLKTYQPLGKKRPREDFNSDESYDIYLNNFNSQNYYERIVKMDSFKAQKASVYNESVSKANTNTIIAFVVVLIVSLLSVVICEYALKQNSNDDISKGETAKKLNKTNCVLSVILGVLIALIGSLSVAFSNYNNLVVPQNALMCGIVSSVVAGVLTIILSIVIEYLVTKHLFNRYKKFIQSLQKGKK